MSTPPGLNPYAAPTADIGDASERRDTAVLAGRGTRFGAALLDGLLYAGSVLPGLIAAALTGAFSGRSSGGDGSSAAALLPVTMIGVGFLGLAAFQVYLVATTGQSLGKRFTGIRIVRVDGSGVGFVDGIVLRSWLVGLLCVIPFLSLVDLLLIFRGDRRCGHDLIAGTKVIVKA